MNISEIKSYLDHNYFEEYSRLNRAFIDLSKETAKLLDENGIIPNKAILKMNMLQIMEMIYDENFKEEFISYDEKEE